MVTNGLCITTFIKSVRFYERYKRGGRRGDMISFQSFRTQVISYHFGHFVPTFIFILVISYPVWSFRTQFGHFVPTYVYIFLKSLWSFHTQYLHVRTQVISYPESFHTHCSHFVPRSFSNWVRNDLGTN